MKNETKMNETVVEEVRMLKSAAGKITASYCGDTYVWTIQNIRVNEC